ncbi:hypothetical protein BMS3Abin07_00183 [bacterium BMS3Abin07]|nr:hypothetical protein BMS3Abin07_00183 [bacterium BMS3Abin07]
MIKDFTADIQRFSHYFAEEINRVTKLTIEGEHHPAMMYKKLIFAAIFDSLSKCIFPKKGNKDRIISFLIDFSEWEDHDRISLPHLYQLLTKNPEPAFSKLRSFTVEKLSNWIDGEIINLSSDPKISEVIGYWPNEKDYKKPLGGVSIEYLQHSHLFYSYRNAIVHEFRHPGHGMEIKQDKNPFYIGFSHLNDPDDQKNTLELVYPYGFFEKIVRTSFENMKNYLIKENINPYFSYTFGSYWIEELNK